MKCIFIYNPVGGKGKIAKRRDYIVEQLKEKYDEVDVYETRCAGDMTRIARESVGKYDAIVFAGGDGSFNELLQGIGDFDELPELGYIPCGTANDVAHSLKIPSNIKRALKVIKTGEIKTIDCMKVNDRYAAYVVMTGAFSTVSYSAPQTQKKKMGKIAYAFEGAKHNLKFKPIQITCKGETEEFSTNGCIMLAFINSKSVAGFKMNRRGDLQDGEIDVAIIERKKEKFFKKIGSYISVASLFFFGYNAKNRNIHRMKGKAFDVEIGEDVVWNIDGEKGGEGAIRIEVVPKKMKILVPSKK